jgi:plasmid stabilization system protein ParE
VSRRAVRLSPAARRDIHRLSEFLALSDEHTAVRAGETIIAAVLSLNEFSERGRVGPRDGFRELVVRFGRAAYIIQYRVDPETVFVTRIFHSREDR